MRFRAGLSISASVVTALGLATGAAVATPVRSADTSLARTPARSTMTHLSQDRATPAAANQVVTLPTGDRVELGRTPTGAFTLTMLGRLSGGGAASLRSGTAAYVIPRSVLPVLGSTLDLSLFDAAGIAARGGRTPVTVTYADPSSPTAVPGVEITSRDGIRATGVITAASSRALGVALRTQDAARLFAGVTSVRGTSTPARTTSDNATSDNATSDNARSDNASSGNATSHRWPMHTVTFKGVGRDGKPRAMLIGYLETGSSRSSGVAFTNYKGIAKVSVPAGIYTAFASDFKADGTEGYVGITPEFTVAGPRTATVDIRTATTKLTSTFPWTVDADSSLGATTFSRAVVDGSSWAMGLIAPGTTPIYLSPTRGTLHGLQSVARYDFGQHVGAGGASRVDVRSEVTGRIPDRPIRFRYDASNTAAIDTSFHGPADLSPAMFTTTLSSRTSGEGLGTTPLARRMARHVSAGPDTFVNGEYAQTMDWDTFTAQGWFRSFPEAMTPGTSVQHWGSAPLHSRFLSADQNDLERMPCSTCIKDGMVGLISLPMSDGAAHIGNPDVLPDGTVKGSFAILADGKTIASGLGFLNVGVAYPAGTTVISGRQTATRGGGIFPVTTTLTTEFSTPVKAATPMDPDVVCLLGDGTGCRSLPMLSADYAAPVDLDNRLAAGKQTLAIDLHQAGRTSPVGITGVKVWVSYDGTTWTPAPVSGSAGHYSAVLTVPRAGAGRTVAGLKITATDAAGSTLTEMIAGAFRLPR